ncbi:hypothetical protein YA0871_26150 [Pseudomonas paralactis]|uniref:Lipoprotein n=1 Tax=Pseudomonas paralactis TaxID=1615673 RepID=A0ABS0V759_9PSED|nr:hypothetical protein [Pseudomonas paralactis]MBI6636136.1 hypothetical protein [Pseudomonas paralactis]
MDANTLKKFKRDINDNTPKVTGHFEVTKSPQNGFKADFIYPSIDGDKFIVTGVLTCPKGEKFTCELHAPYQEGKSEGEFVEIIDKTMSFYIFEEPGKDIILYWAEKGKYEITYIPKAYHLTGKVHFTATYDNKLIEIEYNFNLQDI